MKELTVSMVANPGCAAGMDVGRYNACEAWFQIDPESFMDHVHLRLYDHRSHRSVLHRNGTGWARAWDADAPADGSEKFVQLSGISEMTIDEIHKLIVAQLLEATPA